MGGILSSVSNVFLFPAPPPSYSANLPNLIWIDDNSNSNENLLDNSQRGMRFPVLMLLAQEKTQHTIIYWHGNSCDIGEIGEELAALCELSNVNVCALEYPGFGLCNSISTDPNLIDKWSLATYKFLRSINIPSESIIFFGRSIGSGPATKLASEICRTESIGALVLHCPFLSIHQIGSEYVTLAPYLIQNYWDNLSCVKKLKATCPLLVIHGMDDEVIPVQHGIDLYNASPSISKSSFFPTNSTHNAYDIITDITEPLNKFIPTSISKKCDFMVLNLPESCLSYQSKISEKNSDISLT